MVREVSRVGPVRVWTWVRRGAFWGGGVDIKAGDFALAGGEVIGLPSHSLLGSRRVDLASGGIYAC